MAQQIKITHTSNADINIGIPNQTTIKQQLDEVFRIKSVFFEKSYRKQREVVRLIIWWSIKHYFKILFK